MKKYELKQERAMRCSTKKPMLKDTRRWRSLAQNELPKERDKNKDVFVYTFIVQVITHFWAKILKYICQASTNLKFTLFVFRSNLITYMCVRELVLVFSGEMETCDA